MTRTDRKRPAPAIGDEAVTAGTGKPWAEWFRLLDAAGARKMAHREIVAHLSGRHGLGSWWQQMVTVTYEQARGMRSRYQRPDGFSVGCSRTIAAPLRDLYRAWENRRLRAGWLKDPDFTVRRSTAGKSMRITWVDGETHVEAQFSAKGPDRSVVAVQHSKLRKTRDVSRMKAYWSESLEALREKLES